MTSHATDPVHQAQRELAAWHSTHPDATLAEIEAAVEGQLNRVRTQLTEERTEARAGEEMAFLFGIAVSADTVRRLTEQAGALQVASEQRELERLEQEAPPEPDGPAVQQVSGL